MCYVCEQSADEDYETDAEIMRKTIQTCKRDVLKALKKVMVEPTTFQKSLYNHKYQRYYKLDDNAGSALDKFWKNSAHNYSRGQL